jgi:hypothetical protein
MNARLTRIEARRRGIVIPLGTEEMRIGRDPDCDLVIEGVRASRLHAMIRPLGDRHTLTDSGSTNGTTVNGVALERAPVLLEAGDLIEFSGEFTYLYETGPGVDTQRWLLAACVMVALLLVSSGVVFWRLVLHQPMLAEATLLAREGRDAGDNGDLSAANARLTEAARLLIRNGYLDDVQRSELMPAAMKRLEEELGDGSDLSDLLARAQQADRERVDAVMSGLDPPAPAEAPEPGDEAALRSGVAPPNPEPDPSPTEAGAASSENPAVGASGEPSPAD